MKLSGEDSSIEIEVQGYQYPAATLKEDLNWLSCKVSFIHVNGASNFNCFIRTFDLVGWMKSICTRMPEIVLSFPEDECSITLNVRSHCIIKTGTSDMLSSHENVNWWKASFLRKPYSRLRWRWRMYALKWKNYFSSTLYCRTMWELDMKSFYININDL